MLLACSLADHAPLKFLKHYLMGMAKNAPMPAVKGERP